MISMCLSVISYSNFLERLILKVEGVYVTGTAIILSNYYSFYFFSLNKKDPCHITALFSLCRDTKNWTHPIHFVQKAGALRCFYFSVSFPLHIWNY